MAALNQDGQAALIQLYRLFKSEFLTLARRYSTDHELLLEAYHEGVLGFYDMFIENRYDESKGQIKTLLFKIGKNHLINRIQKEKGEKRRINNISQEKNGRQVEHGISLDESMKALGEKCRQLLTLFYYHNYSIDAIVHRMNYKNENVVKSHKSRCIKQLREIMRATKQITDG